MAITADGVDKLGSEDLSLPANRLLPDANDRSEPDQAAQRLILLEERSVLASHEAR
jgi:hypothetical protein